MKRIFAAIVSAAVGASLTLQAAVVRPAPDLVFAVSGGKATSLKALRGQPVVVLFGNSGKQGSVKKQIKFLEDLYRLLAGREAVFISALQSNEAPLKSDIPFVVAQNPSAVASAYGVQPGDFALAVIGTDGNLDMVTGKVSRAERVLEVIDNAYPVQSEQRKY